MNNDQTQNRKKKGPSYGDDPRYLTVMQKKKIRWQEHPIRSFFLIPVHLFVDYVKSLSILVDHLVPAFWACYLLLTSFVLLIYVGPIMLVVGLFMEGDKDEGFGYRPLAFFMALTSILTAIHIIPSMSFMPWNTYIHSLDQFTSGIMLSDSVSRIGTILTVVLFGVIELIVVMFLLLYGALNNLVVALLTIVLFVLCTASVVACRRRGDSYMMSLLSYPAGRWDRFKEKLEILAMTVVFLIPFYNIIEKDKENYYNYVRHHL